MNICMWYLSCCYAGQLGVQRKARFDSRARSLSIGLVLYLPLIYFPFVLVGFAWFLRRRIEWMGVVSSRVCRLPSGEKSREGFLSSSCGVYICARAVATGRFRRVGVYDGVALRSGHRPPHVSLHAGVRLLRAWRFAPCPPRGLPRHGADRCMRCLVCLPPRTARHASSFSQSSCNAVAVAKLKPTGRGATC